MRNTPVRRLNELNADSGFFVQDRWTMKRLTLFGGFRYDWFDAGWRDQSAPANPFVPARTVPGSRLPALLAGLVDPRRRLVRSVRHRQDRAEDVGRQVPRGERPRHDHVSLNPLGAQSDTRTWTDRDLNGTVIDAAATSS